jgi:cellulase
MVYITPASTEGKSGWVKIYEDGLAGGQWAVDKFYANGGHIDITLPNLKAGDYLLRSEILALHEGNRAGGAQFYNGCGQIKVTGSGTTTLPAGVDLRTVYKANDKSVLFDIYSGATSYTIPGPKLWDGASSGGSAPAPAPSATKAPTTTAAPAPTKVPSTTAPIRTTMVTSVKPAPTGGASGAAKQYQQCGGQGFTGATTCESGFTCKKQNDYYSQCL